MPKHYTTKLKSNDKNEIRETLIKMNKVLPRHDDKSKPIFLLKHWNAVEQICTNNQWLRQCSYRDLPFVWRQFAFLLADKAWRSLINKFNEFVKNVKNSSTPACTANFLTQLSTCYEYKCKIDHSTHVAYCTWFSVIYDNARGSFWQNINLLIGRYLPHRISFFFFI